MEFIPRRDGNEAQNCVNPSFNAKLGIYSEARSQRSAELCKSFLQCKTWNLLLGAIATKCRIV
ncbi:hypothetical protein [Nostoc sphaeroides]|uniref:Uncharacterized protein n=1 Tax=Nostoc sphaeroides CCNUC1 TaxID=2653204 RepID=A0A5P8W114_9NOSO|nr:hypothetical protein [Nostoc sphaeroides]QFS46350.1 hypothetical protein GXM_03831 [Nostoc sphaeroides CCNUC1]